MKRITKNAAYSYGLKHMAEAALKDYVGNGIVIAAAIFVGVPIKRDDGLNAYIGVKVVT